MSPTYSYAEDPDTYIERQRQIRNRRLGQAGTIPPAAQPQPGRGGLPLPAQDTRYLFGQPLPAPPDLPNPLVGLGNFMDQAAAPAISNALSMISRPQQAILTGMTAPLRGEDPLAGVQRGLAGQGVSGVGLLEQADVPEPFRSVGGFGIDVLTDPLTAVTGVGGVLRRGLVGGAAASAAVEQPILRASVARELASIQKPGWTARALQRIETPSGASGGLARLVTSVVSPRILERNPAARVGRATATVWAQSDSEVAGRFEPLLTMGRNVGIPDDVILSDAAKTKMSWGDLAEAPEMWRYAPDDYQAFLAKWQQTNDPEYLNLIDIVERVRKQIEPRYTEIRNKFDQHWGKLFDGLDTATGRPKPYWPRIYVHENGTAALIKRAGTRETLEFDRYFDSEAAARAAGFKPADRLQEAEIHLRQIAHQRIEAEMFEELLPIIKARDYSVVNRHVDEIAKLKASLTAGDPFGLPMSNVEKKWTREQITFLNQEVRRAKEEIAPSPGGHEFRELREGYLDVARGMFFVEDSAKKLEDIVSEIFPQLRGDTNPILDTIQKASTISRSLTFGFDLATPMIQLLPLMARFPDRWARAWSEGVKAFTVNQDAWASYIARDENQAALNKLPGLLLERVRPGPGASEFFEGELEKIPLLGRPLAAAAGRAQNAFSTSGNVGRIELAKALLPMAERRGITREVEQTINHMTGVLSLKELGLSEAQRWIEGNILLFAPRYTRAVFALLGDMTQTGAAGSEARNTLAQLAISGLWLYDHMARAAGQEAVWDQRDSRFLSLEVGDTRVGFGSTFYSLTKLIGKTLLDPDSTLTELDPANPILRFLRGRAPLTTSTLMDLLTGEDFMFNATTEAPIDMARLLATKFMPVAAQSMVFEPGTFDSKALRFAGEFFGVRTQPESTLDRKDDLALSLFGTDFDKLKGSQKMQILAKTQLDRQLPTGPSYRDQRVKNIAWQEYKAGAETLAQQLNDGEITGDDFRKGLRALSTRRNEILQTMEDEAIDNPRDPRDVIRNEYLVHFQQEDRFGRPNFVGAEQYYEQLPADLQSYIDEMYLGHAELLGPEAKPIVRDLRAANETLRPYWKTFDDELRARGLYDWWIDPARTPTERTLLIESDIGKRISGVVRHKRDNMRRRDKEIDNALVKYHDLIPISKRS